MGKKSRRPNRNKPKGIPAAASTAVAAPWQVVTSPADDAVNTLQLMCVSQDWAAVLEVEPQMSAIARRSENSNPLPAFSINFMLGRAHKKMEREGGVEEAITCYIKSVELAKNAGDNELLNLAVRCLTQCYVETARIEEAMDVYKSLCDELGKESLEPDTIIEFAEILEVHHETSHALEIFEENMDIIESSWEIQNRCKVYEMIGRLYVGKNDFAKSNVYFKRQLPIAKETMNAESEASALHGLGFNYGHLGDYGNAMTCLEQALVIESEQGDDRKIMIFCAMGDVLVAQEGREKEGILMFQKCVELFQEGKQSKGLIEVFLKLGQAYRSIEAWDDAIASLEKGLSLVEFTADELRVRQLKALSKQSLGNTYLENFYTDKSRVGIIPEPNDELIRKALFWSEAACNCEGGANLGLFLDLAQENYFLGDTVKAHNVFKRYLDGSLRLGAQCCQTCGQICAKGAIMEKCSVCKVARYCSRAHCIQAWKTGRLSHRVMCSFLKRWRKMTEGKETTTELRDELFNDFFERVLASRPK